MVLYFIMDYERYRIVIVKEYNIFDILSDLLDSEWYIGFMM